MRRRGNKLERWEISIIKMMGEKRYGVEKTLAYFTRPARPINQGRISQIQANQIHEFVEAATEAELDRFLEAWPDIDPVTGLHIQGDELLVKARDAMIAAVHTFNSAGLYFRAELFIVTSIIAWTYLLHAYYKREGIEYRYPDRRTPNGADKYWELGQCLAHNRCPLEQGIINNLKFLIEIRHEIEHRSTNRIDDALSAKLQACCINFNDAIKMLFGKEFALEKRLPIALQFVTFDGAQRTVLIGANLPQHIATAMDNFHNGLSDEEQKDPKFRYRVAFVPKVSGKASKADLAIEFIKPGSPEAETVERVLLKETERRKYTPTQIINMVIAANYQNFNITAHTALWKQLNAKADGKGYGVEVANRWLWYDSWLEKVIEKLAEGWTRT